MAAPCSSSRGQLSHVIRILSSFLDRHGLLCRPCRVVFFAVRDLVSPDPHIILLTLRELADRLGYCRTLTDGGSLFLAEIALQAVLDLVSCHTRFLLPLDRHPAGFITDRTGDGSAIFYKCTC